MVKCSICDAGVRWSRLSDQWMHQTTSAFDPGGRGAALDVDHSPDPVEAATETEAA